MPHLDTILMHSPLPLRGTLMSGRLTKRLRTEPDSGFTLIELLIVIVILGILAAIVVFAVGSTRGDATANSCKTDYKSVELAGEAYYTKYGTYPSMSAGSLPSGSLLKTFPSSSDYNLVYTGGSTQTIQVQKKASGGGWTNTSSAGIAGCDQL
jgi:general secretion pathway protein G